MSKKITIKVPDIGEFENIPVIEVLVQIGDKIKKEDPLVVLESDKATMEVPSPEAGKITKVILKPDDKVSAGDAILVVDAEDLKSDTEKENNGASEDSSQIQNINASSDFHVDVLVLGSGPGGYTAGFRAADLGKKVLIVERYDKLGGVCLNVGCIPSKALLHASKIISEAQDASEMGVSFSSPKIDIEKLRGWTDASVNKLTTGLNMLAKKRQVKILHGIGSFNGPNTVLVKTKSGSKLVSFDNAIIAAGSASNKISNFPNKDSRILDSTDALQITDVPKNLLIIGGGIIGLEMASVYHGLGSKITIAELTGGLIPEADRDLVQPLHKMIEGRYESILLNTKVNDIQVKRNKLEVTLQNSGDQMMKTFDKVLVAVGRHPNGKKIGAELAGVAVDEKGFITVDKQMRTNVPHIFAIGDIVGEPMLAHKASHEGKLCAEIIAGANKTRFDALGIPSVAYTDPELAWVGITEQKARREGMSIEKVVFPWAASGRAQATGRPEGLTKLIFDKKSRKLLGAGIVGSNAGELIAETTLGIEMGADSEDIGLTIHPHPTLSETVLFSAEIAEKSITDLYLSS